MRDGRLDIEDRVAALNSRYQGYDTPALLRAVIKDEFGPDLTLVSSFGTEAAVLLHLAAQVSPAIRVVFVDTGRHFGETKRYRDQLIRELGLTSLDNVTPHADMIASKDPKGLLWNSNPDLCCYWRKTEPLHRALEGVSAWISGRKAFQADTRTQLPLFEIEDGRIKINPLAGWTKGDLEAYFAKHSLPRHPLEADGFLSVGCLPCTSRVEAGEDARAGRWRGREKTECGIHVGLTAEQRASMGDGI